MLFSSIILYNKENNIIRDLAWTYGKLLYYKRILKQLVKKSYRKAFC